MEEDEFGEGGYAAALEAARAARGGRRAAGGAAAPVPRRRRRSWTSLTRWTCRWTSWHVCASRSTGERAEMCRVGCRCSGVRIEA